MIISLVGSQDDESLHSSTASVEDPQKGSVGEGGWLGQDAGSIDYQTEKKSAFEYSPSADRTGLECRIRRLEVGRKRAEGNRRAAGSLKLANEANRYRQMHLACDKSARATATSAFRAMVDGKSFGSPAAVGLGQEHMLALQSKITQEFLGEGSKTAHSEGSGDKVAEQPLQNAEPQDGEVSSSRRRRSTTSRGGTTDGRSTLDELLEAMAGLAKHTEEGPMGLVTFAAWWLEATSKAETELKNRFLKPTRRG